MQRFKCENGIINGVEVSTKYFGDWKSTNFVFGEITAELSHLNLDTTPYYSANIYIGKNRKLIKRIGNYEENSSHVQMVPLIKNDDFKDLSLNEIIHKVVDNIRSV